MQNPAFFPDSFHLIRWLYTKLSPRRTSKETDVPSFCFVFFLCCAGCTRSAWARWTSSCRKWWRDVPRNTWSLWPTCRKTCRSGPKLPVAEPTEPLLTFPSDLNGHTSSSALMIIPACHRDLQGAVLGVGEEQVWMWDPGCLPTLGGKRR